MYKMLAEKLGQPSDERLVVDAYFAAAFVKVLDLRETIAVNTLCNMFQGPDVSMLQFRSFHEKWQADGGTLEQYAATFHGTVDTEPQGVEDIELEPQDDGPAGRDTSVQEGEGATDDHGAELGMIVPYDASQPRDAHEDAGGSALD